MAISQVGQEYNPMLRVFLNLQLPEAGVDDGMDHLFCSFPLKRLVLVIVGRQDTRGWMVHH